MTVMSERVIKLILAYDGTDFCGWQRQTGKRSVQEELEKALERMHGHSVSVYAAGRTDSGVHAAGQAAHFHTDIASIPAERFEPALNGLMPRDVRVVTASEAPPGFHARFDAKKRRYKYFIRTGGGQYPYEDRYAWHIFRQPDIERLNRMAACLRGEMDCTSFAAVQDPSESRFRYIYHALFYYDSTGCHAPYGKTLVFDIAANAFLWRMVRTIVGTLMEFEAASKDASAMEQLIAARDRAAAGSTAPARGLFLWHVEYK